MPHEVDIERIVREVLVRLQQEQAGSPATADRPTAKRDAGEEKKPGELLTLTDKLVTLATLENRLSGVRRVVLARSAVVTPAAIDALAEHGVHVSRSQDAPGSTASLALGVAELGHANRFDVAAFVAALAREGFVVDRLAETGLGRVVAELADQVDRSGRPAVLLTGKPETAACLANRRRGVRAVAVRDLDDAARAIEDTAANLLAIQPVAAPAALLQLVKQLCSGWPRPCPEFLKLHLD